MQLRNRNKPLKTDLLQLSDSEKVKLLKRIRENLQQKVVEAKLWKSFAEAENLAINGETIVSDALQLKGLSVAEIFGSR